MPVSLLNSASMLPLQFKVAPKLTSTVPPAMKSTLLPKETMLLAVIPITIPLLLLRLLQTGLVFNYLHVPIPLTILKHIIVLLLLDLTEQLSPSMILLLILITSVLMPIMPLLLPLHAIPLINLLILLLLWNRNSLLLLWAQAPMRIFLALTAIKTAIMLSECITLILIPQHVLPISAPFPSVLLPASAISLTLRFLPTVFKAVTIPCKLMLVSLLNSASMLTLTFKVAPKLISMELPAIE